LAVVCQAAKKQTTATEKKTKRASKGWVEIFAGQGQRPDEGGLDGVDRERSENNKEPGIKIKKKKKATL